MFGVDRVHELGAGVERLGRSRPLVLCSWRRRRSEEFRHLAGGLGLTPNVFQGAEEHVPLTVVEAAWRAASDHQADVVISFGGGSAIDLGKAVAFMAEHGKDRLMHEAPASSTDGQTGQPSSSPRVAHLAVPTTYSGAEASGCFYVSERQEKRRVAGAGVRPDLVIGDPSLTLTLPWKATGGTGMTALANCLEALCSPSRSEWSESVATAAARSIATLLPVLTASPKLVRERGETSAAAYAAGVVSDVAGRGVHHALCTGLGGRAGVAHGVASAILLPHVLRFPPQPGNEGPAIFARAIGAGGPDAAAAALTDLVAELRLPRRLREVGVFEQDLEPVASWAGERSHEARQDPPAFSVADALAILRAAW